MSEVPCKHCGEPFDKRGIGAHEAHCDGETPEPELTPLETSVHDRDNGRCRRCEADEDLVYHTVNGAIGRERPNVVTLCAACENEIEGVHPRTKRTKIQSQWLLD